MVGGELTLDMLDLTFNPIAKFYEAPIQMKANGGVFVVDDFGRQRIPPRDLLNRWIVPLESRVDYLTLHTGRKFEIPFNVFIIFATNLKPESLADEAFLRRIPYKIRAKNPTSEEYTRIFEMNCRKRGLSFDPVMVEYLRAQVLPAAQARDARLPSARPRRAGRRHVPVPAAGAAHHARPARRRVRELLPRGNQFPGQRTVKRLAALAIPADACSSRVWPAATAAPIRAPGPAGRRVAEVIAKVAIITLFSTMAFRLASDWLATGRFTGMLLLASEALVVALTLVRRSAGVVDRTWTARLLTGVRDVRSEPGASRWRSGWRAPAVLTVAVSSVGLLIVVAGKLSIGRSFGLAPANRGIVSTGLYRLVRHPIYLGYLITHIGFLLANPAGWNLFALAAADVALMLRAVREERTLMQDPAYRAYAERVRWRVVPGVF